MTTRRAFIGLLGGAAVWPMAARAQQGDRIRRIGVLFPVVDDQQTQTRVSAFRSALSELGWVDRRNIQIEYRFASGGPDYILRAADELIANAPDVIVASGTPVVAVLQRRTDTIPIVFAQVADPVSQGFVKSLASPGGNITGFSVLELSIGAKWGELVKEVAPKVTRIGFFYDPKDPLVRNLLPRIQSSEDQLRVAIHRVDVTDIVKLEIALASFGHGQDAGLIVPPTPIAINHKEVLINLAAKHKIPTIYPYSYFVTSGGLLSYGTNNVQLFRQAATYVARILKGAKPAELPVQNPTKYELAINLKTAKALGLEIPPTLLARADEVIE